MYVCGWLGLSKADWLTQEVGRLVFDPAVTRTSSRVFLVGLVSLV